MEFTEVYSGTGYSVTVEQSLCDHLFRWCAQVDHEEDARTTEDVFTSAESAMQDGVSVAKSVIDRGTIALHHLESHEAGQPHQAGNSCRP